MIFLLDADFKDITKIVETHNWSIEPVFKDSDTMNPSSYVLIIEGKAVYDITVSSYKRLLAAFKGNTMVNKVFLSRNTVATTERGL